MLLSVVADTSCQIPSKVAIKTDSSSNAPHQPDRLVCSAPACCRRGTVSRSSKAGQPSRACAGLPQHAEAEGGHGAGAGSQQAPGHLPAARQHGRGGSPWVHGAARRSAAGAGDAGGLPPVFQPAVSTFSGESSMLHDSGRHSAKCAVRAGVPGVHTVMPVRPPLPLLSSWSVAEAVHVIWCTAMTLHSARPHSAPCLWVMWPVMVDGAAKVSYSS